MSTRLFFSDKLLLNGSRKKDKILGEEQSLHSSFTFSVGLKSLKRDSHWWHTPIILAT
jgi:hypothetical protein